MNRQTGGGSTAPAELQVNEDFDFQRKTWRFERVGWVLMGVLCLAALLGLLGSGPLSTVRAGEDMLEVEYQRFVRREAPSQIVLHVRPAAVRDGAVTLVFDRGFAEGYEVESVLPEPSEWRLSETGMQLRFQADALKSDSTIHLHVKPEGIGSTSSAIGVAEAAPVMLETFVYP